MSMICAVTTGRNHSGISLQANARIASVMPAGTPREQAQHRAPGSGAVRAMEIVRMAPVNAFCVMMQWYRGCRAPALRKGAR